MRPEELQALVAAAAPGARITITVVTVEVPAAPGTSLMAGPSGPSGAGGGCSSGSAAGALPSASEDAALPKPWMVPPALAGQAPAIVNRQTPFTTAELAEVLGVDRDTVSGWLRAGLLPGSSKLVGAGWRIPPSAVLSLLAAGLVHEATGDVATARAAGDAVAQATAGSRSAASPAPAADADRPLQARATMRRDGAESPGPSVLGDGSSGSPASSAGPAEVVDGFDLSTLSGWRRQRRETRAAERPVSRPDQERPGSVTPTEQPGRTETTDTGSAA